LQWLLAIFVLWVIGAIVSAKCAGPDSAIPADDAGPETEGSTEEPVTLQATDERPTQEELRVQLSELAAKGQVFATFIRRRKQWLIAGPIIACVIAGLTTSLFLTQAALFACLVGALAGFAFVKLAYVVNPSLRERGQAWRSVEAAQSELTRQLHYASARDGVATDELPNKPSPPYQ